MENKEKHKNLSNKKKKEQSAGWLVLYDFKGEKQNFFNSRPISFYANKFSPRNNYLEFKNFPFRAHDPLRKLFQSNLVSHSDDTTPRKG